MTRLAGLTEKNEILLSIAIPAIGPSKALPSQPKLDFCIAFVQDQLESCRDKHQICKPSSNGYLPIRVLDLINGSTNLIKLVETPGKVNED